jgi:hypothetical protein
MGEAPRISCECGTLLLVAEIERGETECTQCFLKRHAHFLKEKAA